jgi:hypothetical protein
MRRRKKTGPKAGSFISGEPLIGLRPMPERQPKRQRPKQRPEPTMRQLPVPKQQHPKQLQRVPMQRQRPEPKQQQRRLPEQQPGRSACCKRREPKQPAWKRGGGISS